jgi:uncharacterized protein (TIGR02145 family)
MQYYDGSSWVSFRTGSSGEPVLLTVTTDAVTNITPTGAISGGNVTISTGTSVNARGVCWSSSPAPTVDLATKTLDGTGSGSFVSNVTGLTPATTYYLRAYATSGTTTVYGNTSTFTTPGSGTYFNNTLNYGTVIDIEGNIYNTIQIGNQIWMAENLRVTSYKNGTPITNTTDNTEWSNLFQNETGAWCYYNNNATNNIPYGKLYNWYAVTNNNICPAGWHVPSDQEWYTLITLIDPASDGGINTNTAGGSLKSTATAFWQSPNTGANNSTGFSGLPGGRRTGDGLFELIGGSGFWWSTTQFSPFSAWAQIMDASSSSILRIFGDKASAFSVRCLKD